MKVSQDAPEGVYRILSYSDSEIHINDVRYHQSLLLMPDHLDAQWPVTSVDALDQRHLASIQALEPEVLLLGTGTQQQFPARELMLTLIQAGVGLEVMDTASACRTYNLLMAEGRRVLAALIITP